MLVHTPSRLAGPVTRRRSWWNRNRQRSAEAPIRTELVERVRRKIAAGTYETPEKLQLALSRLLDDIGR